MAKDDRKLATRARIVEAAVGQFGRYGFERATVKAIADLAAVSTSTVHWHFATKSGLYAEAVKVAGQRFMATMLRDYSGGAPFATLAQRWVAQFDNGSEATRLLRAVAGDHRHPAVDEAARWINGRFVDFWCGWLQQRENERGKGSETPTGVLGTLIVATLTGLVATRHDHGDMVVVLLDNLARLIGTSEEGGADGVVRS